MALKKSYELYKGITGITYNHLNLPKVVTINGNTITYTYDAAGTKLRKVVSGTTTDYAGNYIYENTTLQFFNHSEGYVKNNSGTFSYVYQYRDHLGNIRLSYADADNNGSINAATEIVEESNYYPFGLKHKGYNNVSTSTNLALKWGYQGQELSEELGYNMQEYKFRHYDSSLGRFFAVDPLADSYVYNSTYAFQENKLGLGTELEGKELNFLPWLVNDAVKNPSGVGAHTLGVSQGLANTVTGTIDAVTNFGQTLTAFGDLASPMPNSTKTNLAIGLANGANDLVNGNGIERGTVIGEALGAVFGGKGTTAATKALTSLVKANKSTKVFRVFGGDADADGFSWTPMDPRTVTDYRSAAGLPSGGIQAKGKINTAEFLITGKVKGKNIIKKQAASRIDDKKGGLLEYIIDPKNVKNKTTSNNN